MGRLLIGMDNYTLKEEYSQSEDYHRSTIGGFWFNFDKPNKHYQISTRIIVKKKIGVTDYTFFSQLLNYDSQQLRFIIELNQNSYLIYNDEDPLDYYFDINVHQVT